MKRAIVVGVLWTLAAVALIVFLIAPSCESAQWVPDYTFRERRP